MIRSLRRLGGPDPASPDRGSVTHATAPLHGPVRALPELANEAAARRAARRNTSMSRSLRDVVVAVGLPRSFEEQFIDALRGGPMAEYTITMSGGADLAWGLHQAALADPEITVADAAQWLLIASRVMHPKAGLDLIAVIRAWEDANLSVPLGARWPWFAAGFAPVEAHRAGRDDALALAALRGHTCAL